MTTTAGYTKNIVNGYWITYNNESKCFVIIWLKTGAEVGYKTTYAAARAFALGCIGNGTGSIRI